MKVLLTEQQLGDGVTEMAQQINALYGDTPVTIVGIMTGSIVLLADIIRQLEMPLRVGVVQTSSYRNGTERGPLSINSQMMPDICNRQVLLIDDIFDTGNTMVEVIDLMRAFEPESVRSAVLLSKTGCQQVDLRPDFVAFEIPDEFVVGYGLDYRDAYRNLLYLAALEESDILSVK